MTNDRTDIAEWGYSSGRVAALESQMAKREFFERMLQSVEPAESLSNLGGSLAADIELNPEELKDAEVEISGFYRALMEDIRNGSPRSDVADLLLRKRELRSFRNYVKRSRLNLAVSEPVSDFSDAYWEDVFNGTATDVPGVFEMVAHHTRHVVAHERADAALFDAAFDSAMLSALRFEAHGTGSDFICGYWDRYDTLKGIEFLWRAKSLDMPDSFRSVLVEERRERDFLSDLDARPVEEWPEILNSQLDGLDYVPDDRSSNNGVERLRGFVDAADGWLMEYTRGAKTVAFGPERIFAALAGLESEAYNMSVVIVGRANGISAELLLKHLRAGYV